MFNISTLRCDLNGTSKCPEATTNGNLMLPPSKSLQTFQKDKSGRALEEGWRCMGCGQDNDDNKTTCSKCRISHLKMVDLFDEKVPTISAVNKRELGLSVEQNSSRGRKEEQKADDLGMTTSYLSQQTTTSVPNLEKKKKKTFLDIPTYQSTEGSSQRAGNNEEPSSLSSFPPFTYPGRSAAAEQPSELERKVKVDREYIMALVLATMYATMQRIRVESTQVKVDREYNMAHARVTVHRIRQRIQVGGTHFDDNFPWPRAARCRRAKEVLVVPSVGKPLVQAAQHGSLHSQGLLHMLDDPADFFNKVVVMKEVNSDGAYAFLLYKEEWKVVVVNDYLPCDREGNLLYQARYLWEALLVKALAKLHGGFGCLGSSDKGANTLAIALDGTHVQRRQVAIYGTSPRPEHRTDASGFGAPPEPASDRQEQSAGPMEVDPLQTTSPILPSDDTVEEMEWSSYEESQQWLILSTCGRCGSVYPGSCLRCQRPETSFNNEVASSAPGTSQEASTVSVLGHQPANLSTRDNPFNYIPPRFFSVLSLPQHLAVQCKWLRALMITQLVCPPSGEELRRDANHFHVKQGRLKNCSWDACKKTNASYLNFVAKNRSAKVICKSNKKALFPDLLDFVFVTKRVGQVGIYKFRLFEDGCWRVVTIDGLLPCDADGKLRVSEAYHLWVELLVKALACGSRGYEGLEDSRPRQTFRALTGLACKLYKLHWRSHLSDAEKRQEMDEKWSELIEDYKAGNPMVASICKEERWITWEVLKLRPDHSYSVVGIGFATLPGGAKRSLVHLRDPHGAPSWSGDWCEGSVRWNRNPVLDASLRRDLYSHENGSFFIKRRHFLRIFCQVDVCMRNLLTGKPPPKGCSAHQVKKTQDSMEKQAAGSQSQHNLPSEVLAKSEAAAP